MFNSNSKAGIIGTHHIHVFISHSWSYSDHYDKLSEWIFEQNWSYNGKPLSIKDYSVPKTDPILYASNDRQLSVAIYKQIAMSHVIVIPTGMYAHYSKWIRKEIDGAGFYSKPILAVDPWGALRTASVVANASSMTAKWNSKSVVEAIWNLYNR